MEKDIEEIYKLLEYFEIYIDNITKHMLYLEKKINRLDRNIKELYYLKLK